MIKIGSHVSISGGLISAAKEAHSYGANTFMIYTGAPQNAVRTPIENLKIDEGKEFMANHNLSDIVVHAPYIINVASCKDDNYERSKECLINEIERTKKIGANYLVLHPGSFTTSTYEAGLTRIIYALNDILTPDSPIICLETMAGKGNEIGRSFKELKDIIDGIILQDKIGVCFDTCHVHDSGYDISNNLDGIFEEFDKVIGLDKLKVFHLNGSLSECGLKKDRHANIVVNENNPKGKNCISTMALYNLVHHPASDNKPIILETPWIDKKTNLYKEEIEFLTH